MIWPSGLYGYGMHDFILDEMELGTRVAHALDSEACGFGPLMDRLLEEYYANYPQRHVLGMEEQWDPSL